MKRLLSILIFFSFMTVATAEEIHLECDYKSVMLYQVDIDLEKKQLWMNDLLYDITVITDLNIVAFKRNIDPPYERITLNRYTGELSLDYLNSEESETVKNIRVYCTKLEKLF